MLQDVIRRKYEACPEAGDGRSCAGDLAGEHPSCLPCAAGRAIDLPLPLPAGRAGRLTERIKEIAETRVRYGYRRIHVLLRREGWRVNAEAGLSAVSRDGPAIAQQIAEAAGQGEAARATARPATRAERDLGDGLRARPAVRRDEDRACSRSSTRSSRFSPAIDVAAQLSRQRCRRGARTRSRREFGYPRDDPRRQRPGVRSADLDLWAFMHGVTLDFCRPGKPTDNAFIEVLQRQVPGGMPERKLVHEPRRGAAKMRRA